MSTPAEARITKIEITVTESPTFGGFSWPHVGQYEKLAGKAFGEVDPNDPKNAVIADIELAPKNARGNVEYSFDFYILKPIDLARAPWSDSRPIAVARPGPTWRAFQSNDPGRSPIRGARRLVPDAARLPWFERLGAAGTNNANFNTTITLPIANPTASITGPSYEYIVTSAASFNLNYPAATLDQSQATLTHQYI